MKDLPDSKLTPSAIASVQASIFEPEVLEEDRDEDQIEKEEGLKVKKTTMKVEFTSPQSYASSQIQHSQSISPLRK